MNIPPLNMEVEQIYRQCMSSGKESLAVVSANSGEGVTSIAVALAQRSLLAGKKTLLVDMNLYRPSLSSIDLNLATIDTHTDSTALDKAIPTTPQLVSTAGNDVALTGVPAPTKRDHIMKLRRPGMIEQCITEWHKEYETIIFDTSPISRVNANNIPPEHIAAACDGCIMVVLAGNTTQSMVASAVKALDTSGCRLIGTVINDRDNPPLKDELVREVERMPNVLGPIKRRMKNYFRNSRMLSIDL